MHDIVEVAAHGTAGSRMLVRELAIVGDATRQRPDCLHLLRLPQLRLQVLLVGLRLLFSGNVCRRADHSIRLARGVSQTTASYEHPTPLAAGLMDAVFALIARRTSLEMSSHRGLDARRVIGVNYDLRGPCTASPDTVSARPHPDFHLRRQKQAIGREVPIPMPFVRTFHRERIALLTFAQRVLADLNPP